MELTRKILEKIPELPGVYLFYKNNKVIYVGKAKNLRKRISSYRNSSGKAKIMIQEADKLKFKKLDNEFLAFIKEAELIKKLQPKFNVILRDDTNYFYLGITKEEIPKIIITHRISENIEYFGPFVEGRKLKDILRKLRRVVKFCSCKKEHLRECLNSQIGLCFGWCCTKNAKKEKNTYLKNIKILKLIFSGKIKAALKQKPELEPIINEIKEIFERESVEFDPYQIRAIEELKNLLKIKKIERIESYDVSHWSMSYPYGVMVVWENKENFIGFNKNEYRVFKIKTVKNPDDPKMIFEIVSRRIKHKEWKMPDLILIDGGLVQFKKAKEAAKNIEVISLAKGKMELITKERKIPLNKLPFNLGNFINKLNKEAHRFAISFHRKIRQKKFLDLKLNYE